MSGWPLIKPHIKIRPLPSSTNNSTNASLDRTRGRRTLLNTMASNPPAACCIQGSFHEGTPIGSHVDLYGLNTYVVGEKSEKIVVILTDIYGNKFNNALLIADQFAKAGYYTLVPDILKGEDCVEGITDLQDWFTRHGPEITGPIVEGFFSGLKDDIDYKFLGAVGYCFGAKYAVQQIAEGKYATSAAVAHPSFVSIEEIAAIKKPLLISAAEVDPIFPEELRHQTEAKLKEIGARYQVDLFSGVSHGFAARGDISNPVIKYAKEKALNDQLYWFNATA